MSFGKEIELVVYILLLLPSAFSLIAGNETTLATTKFAEFGKPTSQCRMYTGDFCKIPVLIQANVHPYDIEIKAVQERQYFRFIKIEECSGRRHTLLDESDCGNQSFYFEQNCTYSSDRIRAYLLIDAVLVGQGKLILSLQNNETMEENHTVTVLRPDRFIDSFHTVYVAITLVIMSVLMGIIVDVKIILSIIKTPVPVLIGIFCQYGAMPAVSFINSFLLVLHLNHFLILLLKLTFALIKMFAIKGACALGDS
jgi:hypothetical protein